MIFLFKFRPETKTINQQLVDILKTRSQVVEFIKNNQAENAFINNVKLIEAKQHKFIAPKIFQGERGGISIDRENNDDNVNAEEEEKKNTKTVFKAKLDSIMENYEKEKEVILFT